MKFFLINPIKKLKLLFYIFFSKILIIFLNFLKFLGIHIRINELETRAIGHYSKSIEIYLLSLKDRKKSKNNKINIDIWFRNKVIANSFLYNYWKKYFTVVPPFFKIFFNMIIKEEKFEFLIPYKHWRTHNLFQRDLENVLERYPPLIKFSKNEMIKAEKILNSTGFDFNKEFFCFANRDNRFRNDKKSFDSLIRNYEISSFNTSLKNLTNKNMGAVRMGVSNYDRLTIHNKYIFDYAFSDIRSSLLDLYIVSKSKFFVVGDGGINTIPFMFRKPILGVNLLPYVIGNWNSQFNKLIIFKKLYSNKKKRYLNYKEVFEITVEENILNKEKIKELEISIVNNSEKETFDLINEYILKQKNEWIYSEDEKKYQIEINNFYRNIYKIDVKNIVVSYNFAKTNIDLFKI